MTITIEYEVEGLEEAVAALERLEAEMPSRLETELEGWGVLFKDTAKERVFPKRDIIRSIDSRLNGVPRFNDFWEHETEQIEDGASLDIWNEHPRARIILFPTVSHSIPIGGADAMKVRGYKLRWFGYDGNMYAKWTVTHPGTPGQPVHLETLEKLEPEFENRLENLVSDFVRMLIE